MRIHTNFLAITLYVVCDAVVAVGYEVEPNNLVGLANSVSRNNTEVAQLYSAEDVDWFKYTVKPKAKKTIKANFVCDFPKPTADSITGSQALYTIGFYNSAGNLQSKYSVTNSQCGQRNFKFNLYTPTAGDYYISVSSATQDSSVNTNYKLRLGTSIGTGGAVACANKGGLVKYNLPLGPSDLVTNQFFYCGYESITFCHPWVWGCRDDGQPPLQTYYLNNQGVYESVLTPPSGH